LRAGLDGADQAEGEHDNAPRGFANHVHPQNLLKRSIALGF
jgi:hypothetical protein